MSHKDKLASARSLIEQFNTAAPDDKKIDVTRFFKRLEESGGVSEEVLCECTWEDIEEFGAPRLLAKRIATVFRAVTKTEDQPSYVSEKKAVRMEDRELVAAYSPASVDSPVANELHKRSTGKRFLFIDDSKVNVDASVEELAASKLGHAERDVALAGGKTYTLRRVKDRPPTLADENPIYKGRALRPDGTCDQTNRSWQNVSQDVRQLVCIAIYDTGEAKVNNIDAANDLMDRAIAPNADDILRRRYVRTAARFDELKKLGELPKLRVVFGATTTSKKNDPFFGGGGHVRY